MAKLRHIAMQVPDLEKAAAFYEKVFGLERVVRGDTPFGNALMLSDGVINLALLQFPPGAKGMLNTPEWAGLHHIGFVVDDAEETRKKIEAEGGVYWTTLPGGYEGLLAEEKFRDPNGLVFDVSEHGWATEKTGTVKAEAEAKAKAAAEKVTA